MIATVGVVYFLQSAVYEYPTGDGSARRLRNSRRDRLAPSAFEASQTLGVQHDDPLPPPELPLRRPPELDGYCSADRASAGSIRPPTGECTCGHPRAGLEHYSRKRGSRMADIRRLKQTWDELGRKDPLWAILSVSDKKGNKWRPA